MMSACVEQHEHRQLSNDLQKLFIKALEDKSEKSWDELFNYLTSLPYSELKYLTTLPETSHYVSRVVGKLSSDANVPLIVREKLETFFPTLARVCENGGRKAMKHRCYSTTIPIQSRSMTVISRGNRFHSVTTCSLSKRELCTYSREKVPVTFSAKKITNRDILLSTDSVIEEQRVMEHQLKRIIPIPPPTRPHTSQGFHGNTQTLPKLNPVLESDLCSPSPVHKCSASGVVMSIRPGIKMDRILQAKMSRQPNSDHFRVVLETGYDVVRTFALGAMPNTSQEVFLNYGESKPWDPYNLKVVPQINRNPDHYVATKFGFLHVYPDGESEQQSFAAWSRDSVVFHIIRQIPAFRDYLPRKMMKVWHGNVQWRKFVSARKMVYNVGFRFHPPFMITLWKINSLCNDLMSLDVHSVSPLKLYQEQEYLEIVKGSEKKLLKYLRKFLKYIEKIFSNAVFEIEARVLELETQKRHMPFVSDIPISIQKEGHLKLEEDLLESVSRRAQIDRLKQSCRHIVGHHLTEMAEISVRQWMDIVIKHGEEEEGSTAGGRESRALSSNSGNTISRSVTPSRSRVPCLFTSDLKLSDTVVASVECSPSILRLREILTSPLRLVERTIILSTHSPSPSVASVPSSRGGSVEALDVVSTYSTAANELPVSPNAQLTGLLTLPMITSIQDNSLVSSSEAALNNILTRVSEEVDEFLEDCVWIEKLNVFLSQWDERCMGDSITEAMEPEEIESALMSGYTWLDKLSNLPPYFTTSHCILSIGTEVLVLGLRPRLQSVMSKLQENCIFTVHSQCVRLMEMAKGHLEVLSCKRYDLEGFAHFAQQLRVIQEEREKEVDTLKRSSTLLNSLLVSGVMVSREERSLAEEMERLWVECGHKVKDMENFVDSQTPLKAQGLQENMESCEQEILQLASSLNEPPYSDPLADAGYVISQLQKVHSNVLGVQSRFVDLGKWRQAITGHPHDMTTVTRAVERLNSRKTIWNLKLSFDTTENEWLRTLFKKLNIPEMADKINDLLSSISTLSLSLPTGDSVLGALRNRVEEYHNLIPLLRQLSSKAVKTPHWHTLLAAVEVEYQPSQTYTLHDLLLYKLLDPSHTELILEVCHTAEREAKLKSSLHNLQHRWEQQMLTLQQKSSDPYLFAFPCSSPSPVNVRTTKFLLSSSQEQLRSGCGPISHLIAAGNTKEVLVMLEEDLMDLQILKGVAHAEGVKLQIEYWNTLLLQLQEMVGLLDTCQEEWWDILKLFSELSPDQHSSCGLEELQTSSARFQEIMSSIHDDPFVLSLLERRRGQKGFRDLQGDSLRQGLETTLSQLEKLRCRIKHVINSLAESFPRLLMLPDWEVLHLNSHHGDPLQILPSIQRMFPAISNMNTIKLEKPDDAKEVGPLSEDGFQIVSVEDSCSQSLMLCVPLPIGQRKVGEWLITFEKALKYSLSCHFTSCCGSLPRKLTGSVALEEEDSCVLSWLEENVSQAVVLTLECQMGQLIRNCLDEEESHYKDALKVAQVGVDRATSYCIQLLRSTGLVSSTLSTGSINNTLKNIILLMKHKQDVLKSLNLASSPPSYDTLIHVFYHPIETGSVPAQQHTSRLGSISTSLTASRSSITQAIPAIIRLQNTHEVLVSSTKSLLSPVQNIGSPGLALGSRSSRSIRSLMTTVPMISTQCYVQYGPLWRKYGFEYRDSADMKMGLTPNTERCLFHLMQGVSEYGGGLVVGDVSSGKEELGKEVARVLGRPVYSVSCTSTTTTANGLRSVLTASIQMGCVLVLNGVEHLDVQLRIRLSRWLQEVRDALLDNGLLITSERPETNQDELIPGKTSISSHSSTSVTSQNRTDQEGTPRSVAGSTRGVDTRIDWYKGQYGDDLIGKQKEIELWGCKVTARTQYGCVIAMSQDSERSMNELKAVFRSVGVVEKDLKALLECLLLSNGFTKANKLSALLLGCLLHLKDKTGIVKSNILPLMNSVVLHSHHHLMQLSEEHVVTDSTETTCIVRGLMKSLRNEYSQDSQCREVFIRTISKWFGTLSGDDDPATPIAPATPVAPVAPVAAGVESVMMNAILRQLDEAHLQRNGAVIDKVVDLYQGLQSRRCAILTGACGSGKTTVYQTLSKAYNSLMNSPMIKGHVYLHVVNPAAYSVKEFLGDYSSTGKDIWKPGIFTKLLQRLSRLEDTKKLLSQSLQSKPPEHWIVLDGPVTGELVEWIYNLLAETRSLTLPNGDVLSLPDHCCLIIETTSLESFSPSLFPHCSLLHCESLFNHQDMIKTWLQKASILHDLCTTGVEVLSSLMESTFPHLISFTNNFGNELLNHIKNSSMDPSIIMTQNCLSLLSSVLERNSPKQDDLSTYYSGTGSSRVSSIENRLSRMGSVASIQFSSDNNPSIGGIEGGVVEPGRGIGHQAGLVTPSSLNDPSMSEIPAEEGDDLMSECSDIDAQVFHNQQYQTTAMYLFALIWSFGAYISHSKVKEFSNLIQDLAASLPTGKDMIPIEGLVFDYYLDLKTHRFLPWSEKKRDKGSSGQHHYITVPEVERYAYLTELYLSYGYNVLLIGEQGCGKTSFLKNMVQSRMACTSLPVTHTLTSSSLLSSITNRLSQLKKRQGGSARKSLSQKNTFLLDDLHLANNIAINDRKSVMNKSHKLKGFVSVTEAVSMIAEQKSLPDLYRDYVHTLKGVRLLATSTPVGTRKFCVKLLRQFSAVPFFPLSSESLNYVVQKKLSPWALKLALESEDINVALVGSLATASVTVFRNVTSRFSPSPTNPHFLFTLHDLAAVWDGMQLMAGNRSGWQGGIGGGIGMMGRRGLLRLREAKSRERPPAGRTTASKRKSGRGTSRRGNETGGGIRTLPSLNEGTSLPAGQSRPYLHRQETLQSGLDRLMQKGQTYKNQQTILSTSLPADMRSKGGRESKEGSDEKEKQLCLLRGVLRLWCHEVSRVYSDRLYTSKDKIWFMKLIEACCKYCFCGVEIEETNETQSLANTDIPERVGGRRARPGRPSRGGAGVGTIGHVGAVDIPAMKLQASDLTANGILYHSLRDLLPKEKQVKLLKYEEVTVRGEDLSSIMFAKLLWNCTNNQLKQNQSVDYSEIGDGQVKDTISEVLDKQQETNDMGHVVMNRQAMEHVIKLCRALVIPGTDCLLLGQRGIGRKTCVKLAAKLMNASVYELNVRKAGQSHSILREACMSAGVEKERVVLLVDAVSESSTSGYWDLVIELMKEGLATSLFTSSEILIMSNKINSEKLRRTNESAFQGFAEAIRSNLHVVITWDMSSGARSEVFSIKTFNSNVKLSDPRLILEQCWQDLFHALFQRCSYIDYYQPWDKESYSEIALQFWESKQFSKTAAISSSDLEALSYLAAHIYLTSMEVLRQTFPTHYQWMVSPRDYVQCLKNGFMLYRDLKKKGENDVQKLHSSLSHLYDLERQASNLKQKLESDLQPRLESAESNVIHHKGLITAAKERYMASSDRCKKAEETIERETEQVKKYKQLVDEKFQEVSPSYHSALETLSSVERTVVMEIMGYRSPPSQLLPVFEGLCLLFDRPPTWEDCQLLMLSQHFYESLRFFDKDSVSKKKLDRLEKLLADQQKISLSKVAEVSQAVVPLVLWIAALVDYRKAKAAVQPYRDQLREAEETLTFAQEVYVTMRQDMLATKAALEVQHIQHKEALKKFKAIEADVKAIKTKMDTTQKLLDCLSNQKRNWEDKLTNAQQHLDCLPAESLIVVAMATYCSVLCPELYQKLWKNWISYCFGMASMGSLSRDNSRINEINIKIEEGLSVQNVLAEVDELLVWDRSQVFPESALLGKALLWRMRMKYCKMFIQVVFDPENKASHFIEELYKGGEETMDDTTCRWIPLGTDEPDLMKKLIHCAQEGSKTILQMRCLANIDRLYPILQSLIWWSNNCSHTNTITLNSHEVTLNPNFQLYILLPLHISHKHALVSFIIQNSSLEQLTNLEVSQAGLSTLFHCHIIQETRRELCIQQKALLADLRMHKQEVINSDEAIMSCVGQIDWSNEQHSNDSEIIMKTIQDTEVKQTVSLNHSHDTQRALQDITKHITPYKKLADHFAVLHQSCQKLSIIYPHVSITLEEMSRLLVDMLSRHENTRFHSSQSSLDAFLLHVEYTSTLEIHNRIAPSLFPDQQLLFPLFVCLNRMLQQLDKSLHHLLLSRQPLPILVMLESSEYSHVSGCLHVLEQLESFKYLNDALSKHAAQWREYFEAHSSLLLPLPLIEEQLSVSLTEKLIIWKIFQPEKFKEVIQSYISLILGPEFARSVPVKPAFASSSILPILCLYTEEGFSMTEKLLPYLDNDETLTFISAFDDDLESDICRLMSGRHTVIIDHVSMPEKWVEKFTRILKVHSSIKPHPCARLCLLLPAKCLCELIYHLNSSRCLIISLPGGESIPLLKDYYQSHELADVNLQNSGHLFSIVNKLLSLSAGSNCTDQHVWSDLQLLVEYLHGKEVYSVHIGYLLSCIMNNFYPECWQTDQCDRSLVDSFLKKKSPILC